MKDQDNALAEFNNAVTTMNRAMEALLIAMKEELRKTNELVESLLQDEKSHDV